MARDAPSPAVQRQRCANCFYMRPIEGQDEFVRCHRHAPDIAAALLEPTIWPTVRLTDWCGDWRVRNSMEYKFT